MKHGNRVAQSEWRECDPREWLQRNAQIVISGPTGVSRAWVEQKHGYDIELKTEIPGGRRRDPKWFSADDLWEPGYFWTIDPLEG